MTTISIHDVGPVTEFSMTLDGPGLWVLRGKHGVGKTTVLRTIQLATDGRTDIKPTKRDGSKRGVASVAGKTITIARQIREEGELGVEGLGELDISTLHAPKFVNAATRDQHRIRTLVRLAGVKADATLFHDLIGGKANFEAVVNTEALTTDDLVEMAASIKRDFEKAAQDRERKLATAQATMRAQAAIAEGVDTRGEHDDATLRAAMVEAASANSRLRQQHTQGMETRARAAKAREQLESVSAGPSVSDAENALDQATGDVRQQQATVEQLEHKLAEARALLADAKSRQQVAQGTLVAAQRHAELTSKWRADIAAAESVHVPSDDELAAAEQAVRTAQQAIETGMRIRQALKAQSEAEMAASEAERMMTNAKRLRDAATGTFDVLSDAIAKIPDCPLRVKMNDDGEARLVIATDRSPVEPFDELSDGERWPYIIKLAATKNRLIVLPQWAYGEFNDETRLMLDKLATEHGCYILSAQVDGGELRGERFHVEAVGV